MIRLSVPRSLSHGEREVLERLLDSSFPGASELRQQIEKARVDEECAGHCPSISLLVDRAAPVAFVKNRVPVEGIASDADEVPIHVLLHVVDGYMNELEVYREDGEPVAKLPDKASLDVLVLE